MTSNKQFEDITLLKERLLDEYKKLEEVFHPNGVTVGTYDTPVNFNESLRTRCKSHEFQGRMLKVPNVLAKIAIDHVL